MRFRDVRSLWRSERDPNCVRRLWSQQLAACLINAAGTPDPADRDPRLLDLAVAILQDLEECLPVWTRGRSKEQIQGYRVSTNWTLARAHHLRTNHRAAVRHMGEAMRLLKGSQPAAWEDAEEFKKQREKTLARFASDLARYKTAAESPPKGQEPATRPNR
ncbi:hypothetical protein [Frigoriglobus tundricola]|uniref:Uncharacterized protein n=1 Tax=Frigoriglobus tundricola TaxID=2774151 RepID=A0A6M5YJ13_9BACT|nr:hypothetical protein [Frigoriglobus tundricola]QJW94049.1 hypothetical protein FTUN_1568 [Frigoriglobus tundricola]